MAARTRNVVIVAVTLVVLGAVGAVQAGLAGARFSYDLEQTHPPLARNHPVLPEVATQRLAQRVVLVIVDGLREDASHGMRYLDALRRRGVSARASSHYPTWSRPNYVSILTGVPPSASGVRTNHHMTPIVLDSLMDRVRAAGLRVATDTDYGLLPAMFLRPRADAVEHAAPPDPPPEDEQEPAAVTDVQRSVLEPDADLRSPFDDARYVPWPGGFAEAGAALIAARYDLVVMLIGAVDVAGHASGGASAEYQQATQVADRAIARALAGVDLARDAVIVVADHGHSNSGGHGGLEDDVVGVPLVAAGAGIRPGATVEDARLIDVAPTVATLLGIPAPGHGLGRTLLEMLALDGLDHDRRVVADESRLAVNQAIVDAAERRADADVLEYRAARIAIVAGCAMLAIAIGTVLVRRRMMLLGKRVLLVAGPAFFIVYFALLATLGQRFSPSLVPAAGTLTGALVGYGIAAMVVQLITSMVVLRKRRTLNERLAAANGIAWTSLMLAMVQAGLLWAFFPAPYINVPGPVWLVLIPAVQMSVACLAITVALTLGLEVIIFVARAWWDVRALPVAARRSAIRQAMSAT